MNSPVKVTDSFQQILTGPLKPEPLSLQNSNSVLYANLFARLPNPHPYYLNASRRPPRPGCA